MCSDNDVKVANSDYKYHYIAKNVTANILADHKFADFLLVSDKDLGEEVGAKYEYGCMTLHRTDAIATNTMDVLENYQSNHTDIRVNKKGFNGILFRYNYK